MQRALRVGMFLGGTGAGLYGLVSRGALTLDVGLGRVSLPLGPLSRSIAAPPETVYDVIAEPYLKRTPRALQQKLQVWERGSDMVLAAHFTRVRGFTATTLETVRFEPPTRIDFRLVRGPVPHVRESFLLRATPQGTELTWEGELGADFWALGRWWGRRVGATWQRAVEESFAAILTEAERRASKAER